MRKTLIATFLCACLSISASTNYLLMHAMGPNVAGVIGSAVAAGVLLGFLI